MTTINLTTPVEGLKWQIKQTRNGYSVVMKNSVVAYELIGTTATQITDVDYPSYHTYSVTITRSGATATVTTSVNHTLSTGMSVTIAGATQTDYNGTYTITVTGATTFTYTVANSPATPATGTITAVGGKASTPGIVILDGYMFVQATTGEIYNSNLDDVLTWGATDFRTPEKEPSNAVAIAKSLNYLCAFKQWDTEFFYVDTNRTTNSPLSTVDSAYLKLGCATADSIVEFDGGIVFMSRRDNNQRSREIHVLNGLTPKKISTSDVERIINEDDLATCYSLYLSTAGHQFYLLTLKTTGVTLAYDFNSGIWYEWSVLTAQASKSVTALTSSDGVATATVTSHGYSDGDPVLIAGANQTDYNGTFNITYVDANTFTYEVENSPVTPATGTITSVGYDESYFNGVAYATYNNVDLVLGESDGIIYALDPSVYLDNTVPINTMIRTPLWDNGTQKRKSVNSLRLVGDRVASAALVRYSDDDYQSWSTYRSLDMTQQYAAIRRLGSTRRRAWEVKHTADTAFRVESAEIDFTQGR